MAGVIAAGQPLIRTPDQRLRVFVSSTLQELAPERAAVREAIEQLHLVPVMFELGARPHAPRTLYRAYLAQSHIFLGVYWQRYGWIATEETVSGLEDEYLRSAGMPQLLYVKEPAPDREPSLDALLARLKADDRASYRRFSTAEELAKLVQDDLVVLLTERFEAVDGGLDLQPAAHRSPPPVPITPTIGRDAAIAGLVRLLAEQRVRLVTLTGPGGVGKSRLALEVARRVPDAFADGVYMVALEGVTDARAVLPAIAERLGVAGEGRLPLPELLAKDLADRQVLLLLDNFEQVIEAGHEVAVMLDLCPDLHALVTSRQPLRLRGERELPVPPLELPDDLDEAPRAPAVELFLERARSVIPDFELNRENLPSVAELVRRLDGLPLAIELAAARMRLLPPAVLLDRLREQLDVLSNGAVDLPERQRTLRTTIDWSYRLLQPHEQRMLDRLSVFAGGATLEAAQVICGENGEDVLETLSSILEKSLLASTAAEGEPRLHLLYTVRVYAAERLAERGEAQMMAERHADWFLSRASLVDPIRDRRAHHRFEAMMAEADDIRQAMTWVLDQRDTARASAFARATWIWFWVRGRLQEVHPWYEQAAALADETTDATDRANLLYAVGQTREILGDAVGAVGPCREAIRLFETAEDKVGWAAAAIALSAALPSLGRLDECIHWAREACTMGERIDEPLIIGFATATLGTALACTGDLPGAREAHLRSIEAARLFEFRILEAQAFTQIALVETLAGRLDLAWDYFQQAAQILHTTRSREIASNWFSFAAIALLAEGTAAVAHEAHLTGHRLRADIGAAPWPLMQPYFDRVEREILAALDEAPPSARVADPWQWMQELADAHVASSH